VGEVVSTFILQADNARDRMAAAWKFACQILQHAGKAVRVVIEECQPTRTLEQNSKMWAVLTDIAQQVPWHVDGKLQHLEPEDWKDILTAGLKKTQRVAAGVEGGFVMLGVRTRKMKIGEMVELIEFAHWFGAEHGVVFGEAKQPALRSVA
jgi:hypothetical protein